MIKKYLPIFAVGMIGGIFAFFVIYYFHPSAQKALALPSVAPLPPDSWKNIVANESLSSVAVQSFQSNQLVRQASGIILSADGLIATTYNTLVSGEGYYQVLFDGRILKATYVSGDYKNNIALLKVSAQGLNVTDLDEINDLASGQEFVITGKFVNFSKIVAFSQKALINYVSDDDMVLNTGYNSILNGAKVVDANGRMAGMAYGRGGKIHLITSKTISDFLKTQFSKK